MNRFLLPAIVVLAGAARPSPGSEHRGLCINEFSALGVGRDWVELYNASRETYDCLPVVLRDSLEGPGNEWPVCIGKLRPGERRIVTCPNLLNGNGEELGLFDGDGNLLDSVVYGRQTFNLTFGRSRDGAALWSFQYPTEREPNGAVPPGSPPLIIGAPYHWPVKPPADEPVFVSAAVVAARDLANVDIVFYTGPEEPEVDSEWLRVPCRDDGAGPDSTADDSRFTGRIPGFPAGTVLRYRIHAMDSAGEGAFAPSPGDCYGLQFGHAPPPVRINEVLASNRTIGRYRFQGESFLSDWIELYNAGESAIDVGGWFLSDRRTTAVPFPLLGKGVKVIPPGGHLLVWAKRGFPEEIPAAVGVNFSLSRNGEEVTLFHEDGFSVVDVVDFPTLASDTSYARVPEGTGDFVHSDAPTPQGGIVYPPKRAEVLSYEPLLPDLGELVTVRVWVSGDLSVETAEVHHWLMNEGRTTLFNDGTHGDEEAGDEIFTCRIGPFHDSGVLHFAIEVLGRDGIGHRDPEPAMTWYRFPLSWRPSGAVKINEVFAGGHLCCCGCRAFQSLSGPLEPRNFVELRNTGNTPVDLREFWLTDDPLAYRKIALDPPAEERRLDPGECYAAWFFGGDETRILNPAGGTLFLVDESEIVDAVSYGGALPGHSYGYLPQESDSWTMLPEPSPGFLNGSPFFLRADTDGDLRVNITDPVFALRMLFGSGEVSCLDAVDSDDNGELEITDPIFTLSYLFRGGPEPPPPFPELGSDVTPDALDCQSYGGPP